MTARKILRRSRPHGPRAKRIEPTVEQGFKDIEDDQEAFRDFIYDYDRFDFVVRLICVECGQEILAGELCKECL